MPDSNKLAQIRERMRQQRRAQLGAITRTIENAPTTEDRLGVSMYPGDRKFDRVTGLDVEVVSVEVEHTIVSAPK